MNSEVFLTCYTVKYFTMLTPAFELSQDNNSLIISITVPYAKAAEKYVYFEDCDFIFHCKPYFLRLNLPGKVMYEEDPPVSYDLEKGTVTVKMKKANPGEDFEDLDLITKLLVPKGKPSSSAPMIEVIGESKLEEEQCEEECDEFDWFIEQSPPTGDEILFRGNTNCGFANTHSTCVFKLKEETSEIFDIVDPETKPAHVLLSERLITESQKFNYEHYLADLYEDEDIQPCLAFSPSWNDLCKAVKSSACSTPDEIVHFTSEEKERLRRLPNKEYLIDKSEAQTLFFGLIDILFAYAYDKRTTLGEPTVESGWTINKLSSTLCWMERFSCLKAVVHSCVRRSLCYPLYRHWGLAMTVLSDTKKILSLGRKYVLKCLLEIHVLFSASDPRYILNDLYITDYCIWIQSRSCKTKVFLTLAEALGKISVTKEDMDLELIEYEQGAELAIQEQNSGTSSSVSENQHIPSSTNQSSSASECSNGTCDLHCHTFSCLQEKVCTETIASRLEDMSLSDSTPPCTSGAACHQSECSGANLVCNDTAKTNCHGNSGRIQPHVIVHMPSLDPTVQNSDDSSESESSSDSCSDTMTESDSEEYSTSSESYSDDSDADSTFSNNSNEHTRLLQKEKCYERRR